MKLFSVRGGVRLDHRKGLTAYALIVPLPLPARLHIPLQQHAGLPAEPNVRPGDYVRKGQILARAQPGLSVPIHASTSGTILEIDEHLAPHPSGLAQPTIVLAPDGRDIWDEKLPPITNPFDEFPQVIRDRVAACGIVGLGGAAFPTAIKLGAGEQRPLDILVINGAECEPYLTCDDRLMQEHALEIIDGARIMGHALGVKRVLIAVEMNKPGALDTMDRAARRYAPPDASAAQDGGTADANHLLWDGGVPVTVVGIPAQYPMGSEKHLIRVLTGREVPATKLPAEVGAAVHNVGTARAVHQAVRLGHPLVSRVVTVSGQAVGQPMNVEAPFGTLVGDLIEFCGGLTETPARLLAGGPMMGQPLPGLDVPVTKATGAVLAMARSEIHDGPAQPCIRCGTCVSVCPCGLMPVEMVAHIEHEDIAAAARIGLADCIGCGSCAYACPSHIPLLQYFQYGKGRLRAEESERRKRERMKRLAEGRKARMERAAQAKRAAMAARRAAAAAKMAAAAPPTSA